MTSLFIVPASQLPVPNGIETVSTLFGSPPFVANDVKFAEGDTLALITGPCRFHGGVQRVLDGRAAGRRIVPARPGWPPADPSPTGPAPTDPPQMSESITVGVHISDEYRFASAWGVTLPDDGEAIGLILKGALPESAARQRTSPWSAHRP